MAAVPSPAQVSLLKRLLLQHIVSVRQYERALQGEVDDVLAKAFRAVRRELMAAGADAPPPFTLQRLRAFYSRMGEMLSTSYDTAAQRVLRELPDFATLQASVAERIVRAETDAFALEIQTTALTPYQIAAIARYPVQGAKLEDWFARLAADAQFKIRTALQQGTLRGEGIEELARRVVATDRTGKVFGVGGRARVSARQLVRTAVASLNHEIHRATFAAQDPQVTDSFQWVASLSPRTCVVCAALDGQVFRTDDPKAPAVPKHAGCRCTIVPMINWAQFGLSEEQVQALAVPPTRAALGGPVTGQTFEQWLQGQDAATIDTVLGVEKGARWRAGTLTLGDLLRDDLTEKTLAELAA